jgi:hypothetical protein
VRLGSIDTEIRELLFDNSYSNKSERGFTVLQILIQLVDDGDIVKHTDGDAIQYGIARQHVCPQCHTDVAPTAKFCPNCGFALATS